VALGVNGTTLVQELNRLANGGTYRNSGQLVDSSLALLGWLQRLLSERSHLEREI